MSIDFKEYWEELPAQKKQMVVVGGAFILFLMIVVPMLTAEEDDKTPLKSHVVRNILTDADPRDFGLDGLASELKRLRTENIDLAKEIQGMKENRKAETMLEELKEEVRMEREEILRLKQDLSIATKKVETADQRAEQAAIKAIQRVKKEISGLETGESNSSDASSADGEQVETHTPGSESSDSNDTDAIFSDTPDYSSTAKISGSNDKAEGVSSPSDIKIRIIDSSSNEDEQGSDKKPSIRKQQAKRDEDNKYKDWSVFIPSGAIISGVLMTGMDAPTGKSNRGDPYPMLLRVKQEAILPNRFKADIRECFIIAAGYGDVSSSRAYVRGEALSCVRKDGKVIESRLDAYAVGEDGKVGIRGRLVSKQGQLIGRALLAGLMEGFAEAFKKSAVPVVATSAAEDGLTPFQSAMSSDGLQSGALNGVSSAMQRVADFYVDMAENIFPVIEVDPGRRIEFIVHRGGSLSARGGVSMDGNNQLTSSRNADALDIQDPYQRSGSNSRMMSANRRRNNTLSSTPIQ